MPIKKERKYLLSFVMILVLTLSCLGGMVNAESGENEIDNDKDENEDGEGDNDQQGSNDSDDSGN